MSSFSVCFRCAGLGFKFEKDITCNPCNGTGKITRKSGKAKKKFHVSYPSFVASGPSTFRNEYEISLGGNEELSYLTGKWRIFQKLKTHRYSTDDIMTSYLACRELKALHLENPKILDIGCGLGSVLMMNAWQIPDATCVGIEAQHDRYLLAIRSVEYNLGTFGINQNRVSVVYGDIRDFSIPELGRSSCYDLITGTPPYFDKTLLGQPGCIETASCLFEHRGGVEDYCQTASHCLGTNNDKPGLFVICNTALSSGRLYKACSKFSLIVLRRVDIIGKQGHDPLFCVFVATHKKWRGYYEEKLNLRLSELDTTGLPDGRIQGNVCGEDNETIIIRASNLEHSAEYADILALLSKPSSRNKEIHGSHEE